MKKWGRSFEDAGEPWPLCPVFSALVDRQRYWAVFALLSAHGCFRHEIRTGGALQTRPIPPTRVVQVLWNQHIQT
jgi:hypothetical protein